VIEEEEDEDDFHLIVDDDDLEVLESFELENVGPSRRRRRSDGPPKQIRQRDHAVGDARIRADYFGPNSVSSGRVCDPVPGRPGQPNWPRPG